MTSSIQNSADMERQAHRNQRHWAKRILAEQNRQGGRRYSLVVLEMAQRAIEAPKEKS